MNTENNILIAEFLGHEIAFRDSSVPCIMGNQNAWTPIKYHSDWNWLMQVVEKIESDDRTTVVFEQDNLIIITTLLHNIGEKYKTKQISKQSKTKIESVYIACVEFIKWYNEQEGGKKD